ncbi:HD domain-containing protein [Candidatus Saccharibacteria bacterium]|nr:HD domain-containing protein [Candidatus Saccharibacteria bacterium]
MTMTNTSERVDALMQLSDRLYPVIDQQVGDENLARRTVRLGITASALALKEQSSQDQAGDVFHSVMLDQLSLGGLSPTDTAYRHWPDYRQSTQTLSKPSYSSQSTGLEGLANDYSDVLRATKNAAFEHETDASHVIHLASLALPYASQYHPELSQGKIALYCLIHDILEGYVGDVATLGISEEGLKTKQDNETKALTQLESEHAERWPEFVSSVHDYENLVNKEAKYVKTFDKLDPSFTHFSNKGIQLLEYHNYTLPEAFMADADAVKVRMGHYALAFPDIMQDRQTLLDRIVANVRWPKL